jgi:hypothetical protein
VRFYAIILLSFFSFFANASIQLKSKIYAIDHGDAKLPPLIFLTTGQVVRLNQNKNVHFNLLKRAHQNHSWIKLAMTTKHELETVELLPSKEITIKSRGLMSDEMYEPTVVENMTLARNYFSQARYKEKESQCFNRATVWSYEWFAKNNIYSNKTWLFFSRKFIQKYKFDWWFHVAPSIKVLEEDRVKHKVMDIKYARGPLDLKKWTDIFIRNKASCPVVENYSDYANYPESSWCFVMRTSMFYYQPIDIEMRELSGALKGNWYPEELTEAYLEALDEVF